MNTPALLQKIKSGVKKKTEKDEKTIKKSYFTKNNLSETAI